MHRIPSYFLVIFLSLSACGAIPLNVTYVEPAADTPSTSLSEHIDKSAEMSVTSDRPSDKIAAPNAQAQSKNIATPTAITAPQVTGIDTPSSFPPDGATEILNTKPNPQQKSASDLVVTGNSAIQSSTTSPQPPSTLAGPQAIPEPSAETLFEDGRFLEAIDKIKHSENENHKLLALAYQKLIKQYQQAGDKKAAQQAIENYLSDIATSIKQEEITAKASAPPGKKTAENPSNLSLTSKQKKTVKSLSFDAAVNYQAREFEQARLLWNKVLKLDPKNIDALEGLEKIKKWEKFLSEIP